MSPLREQCEAEPKANLLRFRARSTSKESERVALDRVSLSTPPETQDDPHEDYWAARSRLARVDFGDASNHCDKDSRTRITADMQKADLEAHSLFRIPQENVQALSEVKSQ